MSDEQDQPRYSKGKGGPNGRSRSAPGGRKCTEQERDRRVELVAQLLAARKTRHEIYALMQRRFKLHWRTVDDVYIVRARRLLREQSGMTAQQAKEVGVAVILDVLRDASPAVRLKAEQRLAEVYGYDSPRRHELSGPEGGPVETADVPLSPERLRELADMAERGEIGEAQA